jgi:hypothetical protein
LLQVGEALDQREAFFFLARRLPRIVDTISGHLTRYFYSVFNFCEITDEIEKNTRKIRIEMMPLLDFNISELVRKVKMKNNHGHE